MRYGAGKLSQRYWEYFKIIEYLELDRESVVLDIGGFSPETNFSFFSSILSQYVKKIIVIDPSIKPIARNMKNIEYITEEANFNNLKNLFLNHKISHILCISVFEHIEPKIRNSIVSAIDVHFKGKVFAATFEYHPKKCFFEYQLTAKTTAELFSSLTNFYLENYSMSPVLCENAFVKQRKLFFNKKFKFRLFTPQWYPLAVKFCKT